MSWPRAPGGPDPSWLHWSIAGPVAHPSAAAFDRTLAELRTRITTLIDAA